MASTCIPRTSVSFCIIFFVHSPSPQRGTYKKENNTGIEIIAAEMNIFLCFIFVFSWSHSGWHITDLLPPVEEESTQRRRTKLEAKDLFDQTAFFVST